jgi:hypothetical protein
MLVCAISLLLGMKNKLPKMLTPPYSSLVLLYTSEYKKSDVVIGKIWRDIPLYSPTGEYNS